jgi:putative transposase
LTELKRQSEFSFLNEISSVPLQQTLRHQHKAFVEFFRKRSRYPRFKSRNRRQSATYTRSAFRWRGGQLWLAKMDVPLCLIWSWSDIDPATLDPTSVTIARDPDGVWHATLHVEVDDPAPLPACGRFVGIDMGVANFMATSDGEVIDNPKLLARKRRNLARYQRMMARKKRGSSNRFRARRKVARAHGKVRRARENFLHRVSTELVRRYDVIAIEDLNVAAMTRSAKGTLKQPGRRVRQKAGLNRAILDAGWATFRQMLSYKTAKWGRQLVIVDRWFPSSKTCSNCGHALAELRLSTRQWTCPTCGALHDRDVNAAKNILAEGLSVTACGADVRRQGISLPQSAVKQEPQFVRTGVPTGQGRD